MASIIAFQSSYNLIWHPEEFNICQTPKGMIPFSMHVKKMSHAHTNTFTYRLLGKKTACYSTSWASCHHVDNRVFVSDQLPFSDIFVSLGERGNQRKEVQMRGRASSMLKMPKLTIHSMHCGENVVTRGERWGSESFGLVSRETSGSTWGGEEWQKKQSDRALPDKKGDCFDGGESVCVWKRLNDRTNTHARSFF